MRICLVSQEYPPETGWGGIGTQTRNKAQGLAERGHTAHVVSVTWEGAGKVEQQGGVVVHRIQAPELVHLCYDGPAFWLAYSLAVAEKLHELCNQVGFDIIQFPEYGAEGFIYQTETFEGPRPRFVVQLHGPVAMLAEHSGWPAPGSPYYETVCFLENQVIRHSDHLFSSSHNIARFCEKRYGISRDRVEVIHSGVDTTRFCPRRPERADARFPKVLFMGKLSPAKGIFEVVEAVLALRRQYPQIVLRAAGKVEEETLERLRRTIEEAGATASFEFSGNLPFDSLPDVYNWCDFTVGPSVFEPGAANVYLEAMGCGKPVVACSTGGAPEAVLHEETGILVPAGDPIALEQAMRRLAEDANLRVQMGGNARDWIVDRFSLGTYIDRVEGAYTALLSG